MARKRAEEAGGGVLRAEAVTANGMVHVLATQGRAKKYGPWDVHVLTPDEAKRLAVELEAAATAVWSAQRLRRQEAERSACCGD
jgi:hypothetical protein